MVALTWELAAWLSIPCTIFIVAVQVLIAMARKYHPWASRDNALMTRVGHLIKEFERQRDGIIRLRVHDGGVGVYSEHGIKWIVPTRSMVHDDIAGCARVEPTYFPPPYTPVVPAAVDARHDDSEWRRLPEHVSPDDEPREIGTGYRGPPPHLGPPRRPKVQIGLASRSFAIGGIWDLHSELRSIRFMLLLIEIRLSWARKENVRNG